MVCLISECECEINQQLVVIAVDGLTSGLSTARYMPKTHVMANRGVYTSHMRTVHDIAVDEVAWDSIFYASSTSVRGCDNNGCDSVAQAIDDMPNWVDILEDEFEDEEDDDDSDDFTVFLFSQDKKTLDDVLDRHSKRLRELELQGAGGLHRQLD